MKSLRHVGTICAIALCFISCAASRDADFHAVSTGDSVVVTRDFQFTSGPSGVSPMQHSCTIPAGVYPAVGTDSRGTYYVAPTPFHFITRVKVDLRGGLYRRGNQFFTCSLALDRPPPGVAPGFFLIGKAYLGSKPHIWDSVPAEFSKFVKLR